MGRKALSSGIFFLVWLLFFSPLSGNVKVINISNDIKVEDGEFITEFVRNLSDAEIFYVSHIAIINDSLYLPNVKTSQIAKLSLNGEVLGRFGKRGEGPGESKCVNFTGEINGNIGVLDEYKVSVFTPGFKFSKEGKTKDRYQQFFQRKDGKIVFWNNSRWNDHYFSVYDQKLKYLHSFASKITPSAVRKKNKVWDCVRTTLYIPEENGIWVSFMNRYDLRYYKDGELAVEIKNRRNFFASGEKDYGGQKIISYTDWGVRLVKSDGKLYFFYRKEKIFYCDIFNISDNYRLIRRLKLPVYYGLLAHYKGNIFYGIRYSEDREDLLLRKMRFTIK